MRIKTLLIVSAISFLVSCDRGCSADQQDAAHWSLAAAFARWHHSLDYMDSEIIGSAYDELLICAEEASACIEVDTSALYRLQSVNTIFSKTRPDPDALFEAERTISELEDRFMVKGGQ